MSGQPLNGVLRYSPIVCILCTSILMPYVAPCMASGALQESAQHTLSALDARAETMHILLVA